MFFVTSLLKMEAVMGQVMIKCPETQKPVSTGMDLPESVFKSPTTELTGNAFRCPECGNIHTWDKKDAYVA